MRFATLRACLKTNRTTQAPHQTSLTPPEDIRRPQTPARVFVQALGVILAAGLLWPGASMGKTPAEDQLSGKCPDKALQQLAPADGFVDTPDALAKLLNAWSPGASMDVDFRKNIVLVATADGPNLVRVSGKLDEQGDLKVLGMSTLMAGPGFGWAIKPHPREGVKNVNGKALKAPADAPTSKPAPIERINTSQSGQVQKGPWKYVWSINHPNTRSESAAGELFFGGKAVHNPEKEGDYYITPWGRIASTGLMRSWPYGWHGWAPLDRDPQSKSLEIGIEAGKELAPPAQCEIVAADPVALAESDTGKIVPLAVGRQAHIRLEGNPTTGFQWTLKELTGQAAENCEIRYEPTPVKPPMVGTGGVFVISVRGAAPGRSTLTLEYRRPWEKDAPAERTFKVVFDVRQADTAPAVSQKAAAHAAALKAKLDEFTVVIRYSGPVQDKPYRNLTLSTLPIRTLQYDPHHPSVTIDKAQAGAIVDHLAATGQLDHAQQTQPPAKPETPSYLLTVTTTQETFYLPMGSWAHTRARLTDLRGALTGQAKNQMDHLLKRLGENGPRPAE